MKKILSFVEVTHKIETTTTQVRCGRFSRPQLVEVTHKIETTTT